MTMKKKVSPARASRTFTDDELAYARANMCGFNDAMSLAEVGSILDKEARGMDAERRREFVAEVRTAADRVLRAQACPKPPAIVIPPAKPYPGRRAVDGRGRLYVYTSEAAAAADVLAGDARWPTEAELAEHGCMDGPEAKKKRIRVEVPAATYAIAERLAKKHGLSVDALLERAVRELVRELLKA